MGTRIMKTTVEISDALLEEARGVLAERKTTLRALIEEGLRLVIERRSRRPPFKLRKASFKGRGLQPGAERADWSAIRSLAYEGRGG
jgi:hypothetical protein